MVTEDDIRRLADRLAMVVSTDGEADNAGRAIGQLARNFGLTGGQLKELLIAGATATVLEARLKRLEWEAATLQQGLTKTQARCEVAEADREALVRDVDALQTKLRAGRRRRLALAVVVVVAAVIGAIAAGGALGTAGMVRSLIGMAGTASPGPGSPGTGVARMAVVRMAVVRMAVVRAGHVTVFASPDPSGQVLASVPAGTSLRVHNMVWNQLILWAEVEIGDRLGYVRSTDVDVS
jgi:hypothetical protein